ncbi:MAG: UDP-3-O-(3-hydroxymyristoyl)glucosamine N-acyltransferase [Candidatus Omnitrophica bacterium]|nr:UDP-3-O-(3-hydroxymyristoyl)glucosamine N-acyltransferase [Candidatus Omnitrophota bacterium]
MQRTLAEIAQFVGGNVVGDPNTVIKGASGIKEAQSGDITFIANSKYISLIKETKASAIVVASDLQVEGVNIIQTSNPSLAFIEIASTFIDNSRPPLKGIHKTAIIDDSVKLGKDVNIGPYVVIEGGVAIGDGTTIYSHCFIGNNTQLGEGCLIFPNVSIRERTVIGKNVSIHSGTVIGSDGFGYINMEGVHQKIPQIGIVEIEDSVEIGANVTVDRARFDKTRIGQGTKIDNLVQIAHNVQIGKNCIIIAQVGISGSTVIEDNVILAGQSGIAGHLTIGANSVVASKSGVPNSIPPNTKVWGNPAKPHMHSKRVNACVQRLPQYVKILNEIKEKIEILETEKKD